MSSLFRGVGLAMIACGLSLSGVASAASVKAMNNQWSDAGAAALTSDGQLFGWGVVGGANPHTTPTMINLPSPVLSLSQNGKYVVFKDGTLFDTMNYSPVAGASAVKAVIEPTLRSQYMGMPGPAWYIHDNGNGSNGAKSFINIANYGVAGDPVQTLIGPGFGLSSVASVVTRDISQAYAPGVTSSSWAWATDSAGQLYDVQSVYDPGGLPVYAAAVTGACTATGAGLYSTAVVGPYASIQFPGNSFPTPSTVQDPVTLAWSCSEPFNPSLPIATLTNLGALTGYSVQGVSNVIVPIAGMSDVVAVADHIQSSSTFVARADGTVWAWGMGIGAGGTFDPYAWGVPVTGVSAVTAVQVPGAANVVSLASSQYNVYALTATGQVYAWGNDGYGQLGQGYNGWGMDRPIPTLIPGLQQIASIYPFGNSVLALDINGDVWAWGDNYWGQLGLGNNIGTPQPVKVPGLTGVTSLSVKTALANMVAGAGFNGAFVIAGKSDGSVWTWGDNSTGQLGNGTRVSSSVPLRVLGEFGMGFLNIEPAVVDVLVGGVSIRGNSPWNGFDFGTQTVNTTSAPQSMTFSNIGMVSWTGFTFGALSSEFAQTNNCGTTLLPGASCTVNFTFTPTLAGVRTASLMAGFNIGNSNLGGAGGPTLTGTGVAPLAVMSTALGFGTQKTGLTTSRTVSLSNTGNAALTVGTPGVTGAGFSLGATTCGTTLAAGTSCTLNVNFAPVAAVAYTGNLTFVGSNNPGGAPVMVLSGSGAAAATTRGDFDGNGMADILWRDLTTGQNAIWLMNSAAIASGAALYTVPPEWEVAGISDFTGNVKSDILWRNSLTGSNALWTMNGAAIASGNILSSASAEWKIASVADFNGDGLVNDILWFNPVTRQGAIWLTNAGVVSSAAFLGSVATGWQIGGVGDFDGDGKSDILWRNQLTGANIIWYINGVALQGYAAVSSVPSSYNLAGVADFNGDAKADILWRDTAGNNAVWLMNGSAIASAAVIPSVPAPLWSLSRTVDYNGDGKADILWRDTAGNNAMWLMNGTTLSSGLTVPSVPANWTSVNK